MDTKISTNMTNPVPNSQCTARMDYGEIWSYHQLISMILLSKKHTSTEHRFLDDSEQKGQTQKRIKTIASHYAIMYLETSKKGGKNLKGRFYWMGLAAFAAKQVYCGALAMDDVVNKGLSKVGYYGNKLDDFTGAKAIAPQYIKHLEENALSDKELDYIRERMLLGNLFLFLDIYPYHHLYRELPCSFFEAINHRNSQKYVSTVKTDLYDLPHCDELGLIEHFTYDKKHLKSAFENIKKTEELLRASNGVITEDIRKIQWKSLIAIANHEQRVILQNCFYAPNGRVDPTLKKVLDKQKQLDKLKKTMAAISWIADVQGRQAVLTNACQLSDDFMEGNADRERFYEDMKNSSELNSTWGENLYDVEQRMEFITRIAKDYHFIMLNYKTKVEGYMQSIVNGKVVEGDGDF
ncbi:DUF2515 family protein [Moraxella equi]|uniref:Uncharacterized protein n=1 Tax=Moraxella equi TaxID=60442 RepID=A0A378QS37_9GAMM|nr:hypothetical protein [Moraxella equi]OPH33606.1 hypothetical protein B5J93_12725 [Moraxella equi]STZ03598.1 Uncharacterised protein [Moraxella equi]